MVVWEKLCSVAHKEVRDGAEQLWLQGSGGGI